MPNVRGTALVTGASEGIGAIYAERLGRRGYDLVLVARRRDKLEAVADSIAAETGRTVDLIVADLTNASDLARVEARLKEGSPIDLLVNNAGLSTLSTFSDLSSAQVTDILNLNVVALARLAWAAIGPMVQRQQGTIINIGSVVSLSHLPNAALYAGTKAFVLTLTQALAAEVSGQGIRLQAVLPGATRTNIWVKSGLPVEHLPQEIVMEAADMVDAAFAGLDQGELVTIPALSDVKQWETLEDARLALANELSKSQPASRYRA
jgi:uncharacterized protein